MADLVKLQYTLSLDFEALSEHRRKLEETIGVLSEVGDQDRAYSLTKILDVITTVQGQAAQAIGKDQVVFPQAPVAAVTVN
ncbi:MAG TPA: hypothetical protein VJ742_13265 [Nitrososphaera sp.]|nr:hypothetical protein [Nitrososphaera sp.]